VNAFWRDGPPGAPLVVLLHGRGADEESLVPLAESCPSRFAVALPRGPLELESGGYTWFENRGLGYPLGASLRANVDLLHAWLDDLDGTRVDLQRIIIGGFSAGMLMASALLLDRPERFHAGVLLSGTLPWDVEEIVPSALQLRGKPVFHAHGDNDRVIPLDLVARSETYLINESGAQVDHRRYPMAHEISAEEHRALLAWFARTIA
jgi:phospholipase/carboxylesterase